MDSICQAGPGGSDLSESVVMTTLKMAAVDASNVTFSEGDLEVMLDSIHDSYTTSTYSECFSVESVFDETVDDHEVGADDVELQFASQSVIVGLLQGQCIGEATLPSTTAFTDAIFDTYAMSGVIPEEEFEHMLTDLGIGGERGHDHDHDHDHARRRRDALATSPEGRGIQRRATVTDDHAHHNHSEVANVTTTCFTGEELLDIYGIDHEAGINPAQFNELSPSLVQQILSGACAVIDEETLNIPTAQTWGYGTLAVFIISMFAVFGGIFVPCMSEGVYDKTIQTMIALAVATLTGDAVLHLLPQAVGLHAHDHVGSDSHTPTSPEMAYIWKCLAVEMAIYVFFVFEQITHNIKWCGQTHSHSHSADPEMSPNGNRRRIRTLSGRASFRYGTFPSESKVDLTEYEAKAIEAEAETTGKETDYCIAGCNPVAMMLILGDSLHNFGDGLAIGAAFTLSLGAGISTSIAVLCHELPHELGDLAVLMKQGMRLRTALLMNMMCACSAFIGLWIGIPLGQTDVAREWMFAAVAGMFLYVGLVDMLPMLHQYDGKSNKTTIVILQNIGFLAGIGIILTIALYEDAITFNI